MTINKTSFEKIYRNEHDVKTKERMMLVLNVLYNDIIPAQAARELYRSRAWASDWLKRYDKEGIIEGLKDRTKSGRPTEIPEEIVYRIKKEISCSKQGWTTKQVEELTIKKSDVKYHYTHIYHRILRKGGFKQKVPRKVHVNTAGSREEKKDFKKRLQERYLWISNKILDLR